VSIKPLRKYQSEIKYTGRVKVDGKKMVAKVFDTPQEAAMWRDRMVIKHWGEFGVLNFPRSLYYLTA
jgi:hypothetical protein